MNDLRLFYSPTCPYCLKVLNFLRMNDITIELCSTLDSYNQEYLVSNGGINQVPCLFIGDKAMYESDDIIDYLKHQLAETGGQLS